MKTDGHYYPLAAYDDEMRVHHKNSECREIHECDHDGKGWSRRSWEEDGYDICECVDELLYEGEN